MPLSEHVRTDLILVHLVLRSPGWELYIERVTINAGRLSLVPRSACGGRFIGARILSFSDSRWVWMGNGRLNLSLPKDPDCESQVFFGHRITSQ